MKTGRLIRATITLSTGVAIGALAATIAALIYILNAHGEANG